MRRFALYFASVLLLADGNDAWKNKKVAEWSDDDAKQVLSDSPWVKTVMPTLNRSNDSQPRQGGLQVGGIPGFGGGGGRRGRGGYPRQSSDSNDSSRLPMFTLRWESALPIREAELKARETNAPTLEDDSYAIAVYGIPVRTPTDPNQLKKQASIKRDGKKDLKPASVQVIQREDGFVVVYLFPRSKEITREDRRVEFEGQIGRFQFTQSFYTEDMNYQGKLEL